ncbi:MAG: hypothetical protein AAFR77_00465 [Cyanobacteria bacterium J06631_2]
MLSSLFKKLSISLTAAALFWSLPEAAKAETTLKVDRDFALERLIKVDVTQMGIVIDFDSKISSVNLSHMGQIIFQGFDGVLCKSSSSCPPNSAPTMLIVRKIPDIEFKNQLPSVDGSALLFVNTTSGVYRVEFNPVSAKPKYTKVEIKHNPLPPLFSAKS